MQLQSFEPSRGPRPGARIALGLLSVLGLIGGGVAGCTRDAAPAEAQAAHVTEAPSARPSGGNDTERGEGHGQNRGQRNANFRVPLLVFAASSLREAMEEIGPAFTAQGRPVVEFNFAGSNVLAQQLEASTRGEVFVSADEAWVTHLEQRGGVEPGTKHHVLSNTLAIVAHAGSSFTLADPSALASLPFAHLSMADPDAVPAGRYAKAYLASLASTTGGGSIWDRVAARVAPAADVRAALAVVTAQADVVGIVYHSDVNRSAVRTLYDVPVAALPTPIRYVGVAIANRPRIPLATAFVEFLGSPEARAIFERHGFLLPAALPGAPAPQPVAAPGSPPGPSPSPTPVHAP